MISATEPSHSKQPLSSKDPLSLHIGIAYGRGGEGRVVSELMRSLPPAGIRFRGLVAAPDSAAQRTDGVITSFASEGASLPSRLLGARRAIRTRLREEKVDLVASHFALYTAPALDLLAKQPLVCHFHGPWALESLQEDGGQQSARFKTRLERSVYRRADRLIVLSDAFRRLLISSFGVDEDRVRIVPGSVDLQRFNVLSLRAESRQLLSIPEGRPILVCVRRLVQRMGLHNLLDAMPKVVAAIPEILLCIGGEGPTRPQLEEQIQRLGLEANVKLLGFVDEEKLPHLYHAADINVVPTLALEGFGLVAAEAMATGTPSMVTPVGGLPEVVSGLSTGLVFQSSSPQDLAQGLCDALLGATPLPERAACQAYVHKSYSSELMASRTARVYRELLSCT